MATQNSEAANLTVSLSERLNEMIEGDSLDYKSWKLLLLEIESSDIDDVNLISLAYDSFLEKFPLCHWHLEKYAYHKAKLCGAEEAIKIFEQGVESSMFSVGFWVAYFTFGAAYFEDPEDVRRLFARALLCVGKDYFCHAIWDKYMKYELIQEGWDFLAQSYIQALKFPTKKLQFYYDNFKQFVANLEDEIGFGKNHCMEVDQASVPSIPVKISRDEISVIIKDLLDSPDRSLKSNALIRYRSIGEKFYQEARHLDERINCFEADIKRRYFCATPLDDGQLDNWHLYLDFIEKQKNLDWAVQLYERCLIPCATYPEFWMRYVEFLEPKGGCELANAVLDRSTKVFLKNVPEIHLFNARFKEHSGDTNGAHAAFLAYGIRSDSSFIDNIVAQANMERRLGSFQTASGLYEKAIESAIEKQRFHVLPSLYSHFARLTYMVTGRADAAKDVLVDGIQHVPRSRFLLEELIKFAMMHEEAAQVNAVDSIVADAILPGSNEYEGLNAKDREAISCLYLEFVDLCGTVHDIRKAWLRHVKLFPKFLRSGPMYKQFTSNIYSSNVRRDKKGSQIVAMCNQSSKAVHIDMQKRILEPQTNLEIQELEMHSPQKADNNDSNMKTVLETDIVVPSNEDADRVNELSHDMSCQSREDERQQPMEVTSESPTQSKENSLGPLESTHEFGNLSEATQAYNTDVNQQLTHENRKVSMDFEHLKFRGKETETWGLKASDEFETKRNAPVSSVSTPPGSSHDTPDFIASPKMLQTFDHPQLHNEKERDGSVYPRKNTPKRNSEDCSISIREHKQKDHVGLPQNQEHEVPRSFHQQNSPAAELCRSNTAKQDRGKGKRGAIHKDRPSDEMRPATMRTLSRTISRGQSPFSSPPVSYPQQNMQQMASVAGQHHGQVQQNLPMDQTLQYHYQQQQFLQQQYQQQYLYMQQPNLQMQHYYMNQQPYQQNMQAVQHQNYVQSQTMPYQLQQEFQLSQQQLHDPQTAGNLQQQHSQQPHLSYQHAQEIQYNQSQDQLSENVHQLGYQQLYWQQFQQYQQTYQHLQQQQQQQLQEVHPHSREKSLQNQDEHEQHINSQQNSAKDRSQNQPVPGIASPEYYSGTAPSESPHLPDQSRRLCDDAEQ